MTSSSEEDSLSGAEGRGARSESVTYPRFFLVGMTSSSDSSSSLTGAGAGAGAGAGKASGTRSRSAAASSFDHSGGRCHTCVDDEVSCEGKTIPTPHIYQAL